MKKITLFFGSLLLLCSAAQAQDNPIKVKTYGYIGYEILYDTYRSVDTRDGELYLFPKKPQYDINGKDINERSKLNMLSLQSRIGFDILGPDAFGAKTSAKLEGDFFATKQDYTRHLRLRIAMIKLNWTSTELLMGHAFHPTFVLDCFPSTVSFGAAVPFHPLNRSSQVRLTQKLSADFSASLSLLMHTYHMSPGPTDAQRNSGLPESVLQLRYGNASNVLMGITAGYKFLSPRDITTAGVATTQTVGAYNLQAFSKIKTNPFTLKLEAMYGENLSQFVMIGGYGAKGTDTDANPFNWDSDYDYANLRTLSLWADLHSNNKVLQWGLFAGYTENMGSKDTYLTIPSLASFDDLHSLFRISPRLVYYTNNLSFGLEYSYYSAIYAEEFDANKRVIASLDPIMNNHIVFLAKYDF